MLIRTAKESNVLFLKRLLAQPGYSEQDEIGVQQKITDYGQEGYRLLNGRRMLTHEFYLKRVHRRYKAVR